MGHHGRSGTSNRAPKKPPLTHFLCLPLVNPSSRSVLDQSLKAFTKSLSTGSESTQNSEQSVEPNAENQKALNINPKAVRPYGTLHCTLGVMSLDDEQLEKAKDLLNSLDLASLLRAGHENAPDKLGALSVNGREPISVELKGLVSMHSPQKTSILYCDPVDKTGRLYPFCQAVQEEFKKLDLLVPENRPLKLHATILNTIYARERGRLPKKKLQPEASSARPAIIVDGTDEHLSRGQNTTEQNWTPEAQRANSKRPLQVDARSILKKHQDFVWADNIVLDRISICEMGAKKTDGEFGEAYNEVASIPLPCAPGT